MNKIAKIIKLNYKYILLLAWMLVIFKLSNEPSGVSSGRSDLIVQAISGSLNVSLPNAVMTFLVRKSAHIFAYFVLGILTFNLVRDYKINTKLAVACSVGFAFLYAISDELHQLFVVGRSCEVRDVLIDTTASIVGIGLFCLVRHLIYKYQKPLPA